MGSRPRNSSGRSAAPRHKPKRKASKRKPLPQSRPSLTGLTTVLGTISDSISIVTTAARALVGAQEQDGKLDVREAGDELVTLQYGVSQLRQGYRMLELSFRSAAKFAREEERRF